MFIKPNNVRHRSQGFVFVLVALAIMAILLIVMFVLSGTIIGDRTGAGSGMTATGGGGFCSGVPDSYQTIFNSYTTGDIPASMLAAVFSIEHGKVESYAAGYTPVGAKNDKWPEENGDPTKIAKWQTSSADAKGPMQFIDSTWKIYGSGDVQNINDAVAATAKMMQANFNSNSGSNEEKLRKAVARYNPGAGPWNKSWYVDKVWKNYENFNCGGSGAGSGDIVAVAIGELGTAEHGGKDCGVEKYTLGGCEPWCADFVSWVYNQAGYKFKKIAGAKALYNWFGKYHYGFKRGEDKPQPGDLVYFSYSHVGIVETVSGNNFTTIEGNTKQKNVGRKHHKLTDADVVGFGRWVK